MLASLLADTLTDGSPVTWLIVVAVVLFILCALIWLIRSLR